MRPLYHPDSKAISLAGVLYALGDPVRLEIVRRLAEQPELPCAAFDCAVPRSTMSHHFRVLREAGVLYCRKEGTQHLNSLRRRELDELFPGLLDVVLRSMQPPSQSASLNAVPSLQTQRP
ncbi:MAG: helix-turn-helix transcriptional regulator [Synechococcales cyanobacterium C42_A2020_086]|jgi:DNA-binding transcriptional ArsR family regulator|nr:helix-turn-helix transcriptional regulator [Synechococcales cyanobacterium M58_A2018_015]MBF2073223.1 helix-turn-helix transcriptional regulator [Synechococcales cyanobacterium C42_A2020_086]